ncbi:unnamed protein product [Lampetra planeri]
MTRLTLAESVSPGFHALVTCPDVEFTAIVQPGPFMHELCPHILGLYWVCCALTIRVLQSEEPQGPGTGTLRIGLAGSCLGWVMRQRGRVWERLLSLVQELSVALSITEEDNLTSLKIGGCLRCPTNQGHEAWRRCSKELPCAIRRILASDA